MDKEKVQEAANGCHKYPFHNGSNCIAFKEGFKRGAEWLMTQPLEERLTEVEKQRIQKFLDMEVHNPCDAIDAVELITDLFGDDFLMNKPESNG